MRRAVFDVIGGALLEERRERTLACRLLMRLCVVDGELHPSEQAVLDATMARYGLGSPEQLAIANEMAAFLGHSADPQALADAAEPSEAILAALSREACLELWTHLEHGAWADGRVVPAEANFLEAVRRRLGG